MKIIVIGASKGTGALAVHAAIASCSAPWARRADVADFLVRMRGGAWVRHAVQLGG